MSFVYTLNTKYNSKRYIKQPSCPLNFLNPRPSESLKIVL